jgi:hypothetical protein
MPVCGTGIVDIDNAEHPVKGSLWLIVQHSIVILFYLSNGRLVIDTLPSPLGPSGVWCRDVCALACCRGNIGMAGPPDWPCERKLNQAVSPQGNIRIVGQ